MVSEVKQRPSFYQKTSDSHHRASPTDPWTHDVYNSEPQSSFTLLSGSTSTLRRQYSYTPLGIRKKHFYKTYNLPFNWLQLASIFLGSVAFLLMIKLIYVIMSL